MDVEDADGKVVLRVASAFHFPTDRFDFHSGGVLFSWKGGSRVYSEGVLQDVRMR
jgi:hypothetical protein